MKFMTPSLAARARYIKVLVEVTESNLAALRPGARFPKTYGPRRAPYRLPTGSLGRGTHGWEMLGAFPLRPDASNFFSNGFNSWFSFEQRQKIHLVGDAVGLC